MADWKELAKNKKEWATVSHDDPRLDAFAHEVERRYGLPKGVVEAIKNAGERTPRKGAGWAVSPVGAQGVMQFMPPTRGEYQHDVNDPFASIDAAGRYMADLMKDKRVKGNPMAALGWYNGGYKAAVAVNAGRQPPSEETRGYLERIRTYMNKKYGDGQ